MEGIQKDVDALQQQMMELQMSTGIQTSITVLTTKDESEYFFTIQINVNGEFNDAAVNLDFDSAMCYLYGLLIGYDMANATAFKKIHAN